MKTLKMLIEVTYDDDIMHGNDPDSIDWFREKVLFHPAEGEELILHSNAVGDSVGEVKVLEVYDE